MSPERNPQTVLSILLAVALFIGIQALGSTPAAGSGGAPSPPDEQPLCTDENGQLVVCDPDGPDPEPGPTPGPAPSPGPGPGTGVLPSCFDPDCLVLWGAVPFKDLNLPEDYMYDAWGNRLLYFVVSDLAMNYDVFSAADILDRLQILDGHGVKVTSNGITYVIVSPGPNAMGAITADGVPSGAACSASTMDRANCDGDTTFIRAARRQNAGDEDFDDLVLWGEKRH